MQLQEIGAIAARAWKTKLSRIDFKELAAPYEILTFPWHGANLDGGSFHRSFAQPPARPA
ncbi:MAG: hypothetical protein DCC67_08405 [Planctomycetota bacterium]|nr:MAG: hypothetical protein DCC67_08405 [Planctomycetota bacterium]